MDARMAYVEHAPDPELAGYVDCFWEFQVAATAGAADDPILHTVPPDGGVSLGYSQRWQAMGLIGPRLDPFQPHVVAGERVFGIRFWPGVAASVLGVDAMSLRGCGGPATLLAGQPWLAPLCRALALCRDGAAARAAYTAWLRERLATPSAPLDAVVMDAVFAVIAHDGAVAVTDLVERSGLSPRQFRRRFRAGVGLGPKELARVRRVRASIVDAVEARQRTWVEVALAHGYSDQAHLTHEFRRLVGLPPDELRAYLCGIEHERRRAP